jgi:cell division protein FtsZ
VIKVIGLGGGGSNTINRMIELGLTGIDFIAANTDAQALKSSLAPTKIQLGPKVTRGLGAGGDPRIGEAAAEESYKQLNEALKGADMVFLTAGMGGGTGTGAAPVIAKIAREMGILTLGIVTSPFPFEGKKRADNADHGIKNLREYVDTLIVIPNGKLSEIYSGITLEEAFNKADNILFEAAKAVSDIINVTGYMNVDFADVKAVMQNMGYALMGSGVGEGENRAINAARSAIDNPLLRDLNLQGCQSLLLNITAGHDFLMSEFEEVTNVIVNETGKAGNIITGVILEDKMSGKINVTIIATGLERDEKNKLIDFPGLPVHTQTPVLVEKSAQAEIDDILSILNINQPAPKEERKTSANEPNRIPSLRTDVPSFLKALD